MGRFTDKLYKTFKKVSISGDHVDSIESDTQFEAWMKQAEEDIRYIRKTLETFMGYCSTPAKILSWCFTAMAAGIIGEFGFRLFKMVARLGGKL